MVKRIAHDNVYAALDVPEGGWWRIVHAYQHGPDICLKIEVFPAGTTGWNDEPCGVHIIEVASFTVITGNSPAK